ncbi:hypothetical protein ACH4U6_35260 [Streptomyces netropsis]|uniref:hypothetical protein n=1 Tax=Streptomyces netropsis TaxID=55404 RepID=UPI0037BB6AD8
MIFVSKDSVKTMKCIRLRVLIADIAFTEKQFPMRRRTKACPDGGLLLYSSAPPGRTTGIAALTKHGAPPHRRS